MIRMTFLSVIIPFDTVERYLKDCLDSLSEQNLKDCEIIASSEDFSVEEIAGAVGYSSENLFYNHFKRHIGTTPHKYKKKYKE